MIKNLFKFEPVATLAALQVFSTSVLALVAFTQDITAENLALIAAVVQGGWAVVATFVRNAVTPTASLEELAKLSPEQLAALARFPK